MRLAEPFGALPPDIARPRYERRALGKGIVHLGLGAFQRAHVSAVNEAALHATGDLRWGIVGVSLRHADTRDALAPHHALYTLALRDAGADGASRETLQVIGCVLEVLVAPEDPQAVLDRIAHAETRIVSLTITEKGYCHDPASGALRLDDADIANDLAAANAHAPRSAIGFIAHGLHRRMRRGLAPVTLLSCDNLPANGRTLRGLVLEFAARIDPMLHSWIESRCRFPNSMVDRIVPRTSAADRKRIALRLGVEDAWPVVAEPFLDWIVEDDFAAGRPEWQAGGARFVADAEPFERLKLRMVNGSHSALAYLGAMAGLRSVDAALASPPLRRYVDALMRDEIASTLPPIPGLDLNAYRSRLLERFSNPALQHQTRQIAMDGSQKLPQRLLNTVRDRLRARAPIDRLALAVAAWIRYLGGVDEAGETYPIDDPLALDLAHRLGVADLAAAQLRSAHPAIDAAAVERCRIKSFTRYAPVFGTLGADAGFVEAVARQALALRERGVLRALEAIEADYARTPSGAR